MDEKRALALGYMQGLKTEIDELKEKRRKQITHICDRLSMIASDHSGYTADFDASLLDEAVRKLHSVQRDLMTKITEHNLHAERAEAGRILTRSVIVSQS